MNLCLVGHSFRYELEKLVRIFMPFEKIEFFDTVVLGDCYAVTSLDGDFAKAEVNLWGEKECCELKLIENTEDEQELRLALCLYDCFEDNFLKLKYYFFDSFQKIFQILL